MCSMTCSRGMLRNKCIEICNMHKAVMSDDAIFPKIQHNLQEPVEMQMKYSCEL